MVVKWDKYTHETSAHPMWNFLSPNLAQPYKIMQCSLLFDTFNTKCAKKKVKSLNGIKAIRVWLN